jgi:hypothetical protein
MLQIHIRTVASVDLRTCRALPQHSVSSVHLETPDGKSIELWSQQSRSFPMLSQAEAEGAKLFDGLPEAFTPVEAEAAALEWIRANLLDSNPQADRLLLYAKPESGRCIVDSEEIEFRPTG